MRRFKPWGLWLSLASLVATLAISGNATAAASECDATSSCPPAAVSPEFEAVPEMEVEFAAVKVVECFGFNCADSNYTQTLGTTSVGIQGVVVGVTVTPISASGQPAPLEESGTVSVDPKGGLRVAVTGLSPSTVIRVYLNQPKTLLAQGNADAQGNYTATYPVPAGIEVGRHTLQLIYMSKSLIIGSTGLGLRVAVPAPEPTPTPTPTPTPNPTTPAPTPTPTPTVATVQVRVTAPTASILRVGSTAQFKAVVSRDGTPLTLRQLQAQGKCPVRISITRDGAGEPFLTRCAKLTGSDAILTWQVSAFARGGITVKASYVPRTGSRVTAGRDYEVEYRTLSASEARFRFDGSRPGTGARLAKGSEVDLAMYLRGALTGNRASTSAVRDLSKCVATVKVVDEAGKVLLDSQCLTYSARMGTLAYNWLVPTNVTGTIRVSYRLAEPGRTAVTGSASLTIR